MVKKILHWTVRLSLLTVAVLLTLGGPVPETLAGIFPGLSPLVLVSGTLSEMSWYRGLFWGGPALAVLALAIWRGRFFCRWICPAGTAYALASQVSRKKRLLKFRFNGIIFWAVLGGAVAGMPIFIFLDPLASFGRMTPFINGVGSAAAVVPGVLVPVFVILSLFQPFIWCTHFCPLGYCFDLVYARRNRPVLKQPETRRNIITGLAIGTPLALLMRRLNFLEKTTAGTTTDLPILPPGAGTPAKFAARCSRCYACVDACPTRVIRVKAPFNRNFSQFFQPELDYSHYAGQSSRGGSLPRGYCDEFCTICTETCPTGAITRLSEEKKHAKQIGIAKVREDACLAWADKEHCMVCQEYCPYLAIGEDVSEDGIPRPVVDTEICRGCGFCQNQCPAIRDGVAIVVHGVEAQNEAKDFF
ncbi:MAG: 4Fe-4S binding protein [Lentisphaeria bacterium]